MSNSNMLDYTRTLYPEIEPYETGMLDVGEGHQLYYERVGTPGGKPAVFLHGGPGGGMAPSHRRQWDPEKYDVLLFDQRGCGQSLPFAEIENNDTWRVVADIERLREMCGHDKWQVFGGSWGATLALAYSQAHPDRTSEIILRGVFLARQAEKGWLYTYGASEIMAEQWDAFSGHIPAEERGDLVKAYYDRLTSDDDAVRLPAAKEWSLWEGNVATLLPDEGLLDDFADPAKAVPFARICARFFLDDFYLEEAQLLRDVDKIRHIPTIIVQGRHDICTPPRSAWDLKKAFPEADLRIVQDAGHSASEPGIIDGLVRATDEFAAKNGQLMTATPIQFSLAYNEQEQVAAMRFFIKKRWLSREGVKSLVVMTLLWSAIVMSVSLIRGDLSVSIAIANVVVGLLAAVGSLTSCYILQIVTCAGAVRKNTKQLGLKGTQSNVTLTDDAITIEDQVMGGSAKWKDLHSWAENDQMLMIFRSENLSYYFSFAKVAVNDLSAIRAYLAKAQIAKR